MGKLLAILIMAAMVGGTAYNAAAGALDTATEGRAVALANI